MTEYITIVTELAPRWRYVFQAQYSDNDASDANDRLSQYRIQNRIQNMLGRNQTKNKKAKPLMAVLEVGILQDEGKQPLVSSIKILQSNSGAAVREILKEVEDSLRFKSGDSKVEESSLKSFKQALRPGHGDSDISSFKEAGQYKTIADKFVKSLPSLTDADCLVWVDKSIPEFTGVEISPTLGGEAATALSKFDTLQEQHEYFEQCMLFMARQGHEDKDGWNFASTVEPVSPFAPATRRCVRNVTDILNEKEMVDVYQREVSWSAGRQYRSCTPRVNCSLAQAYQELAFDGRSVNERKVGEVTYSFSRDLWSLHEAHEASNVVRLMYRILPLPWPLASRDFYYVSAFVLNEERQTFIGYTYDAGGDAVPQREGFVRGGVKFQGYVAVPEGTQKNCIRLTWMQCVEARGGTFGVPNRFVEQGSLRMACTAHHFKKEIEEKLGTAEVEASDGENER